MKLQHTTTREAIDARVVSLCDRELAECDPIIHAPGLGDIPREDFNQWEFIEGTPFEAKLCAAVGFAFKRT